MLRYLHSLSAWLFYLLAGAFFAAYILYHNDILARTAGQFLYIGQLPLLIASLLYGGLSVYQSIRGEESTSRTLGIIITLPLAVLFLLFLMIRFAM